MEAAATEVKSMTDTSDCEDFYIFECFKERRILFAGSYLKYNLILERLSDWDVWQFTIISEAYSPGLEPEEVFLLENVEEITYGLDRRMQ